MLEIGLTGGIGSGKSTVAGLLVDRGATLLDADAIVRELQEPGTPVFVAMVARWGDEVVTADGLWTVLQWPLGSLPTLTS